MPNIAIHPHRVADVPVLAAVVDGYPEEEYRLSTSTGDEPLEDGAEVTDHAVARKEILKLTGWVSNLVIGGEARPGAAWGRIRELNRELTPVRIVAPFGVYRNMLLREAEAKNDGGSLRFTLHFAEIQRVGIMPGAIVAEETSGPAVERTSEVARGRVIAEEIEDPAVANERLIANSDPFTGRLLPTVDDRRGF